MITALESTWRKGKIKSLPYCAVIYVCYEVGRGHLCKSINNRAEGLLITILASWPEESMRKSVSCFVFIFFVVMQEGVIDACLVVMEQTLRLIDCHVRKSTWWETKTKCAMFRFHLFLVIQKGIIYASVAVLGLTLKLIECCFRKNCREERKKKGLMFCFHLFVAI